VRRPFLPLLLVAAVAFVLLGFGIERASVGTAYSDPVSKLRAQDECTYANSALGLAHAGGWLTPKVLGRYLLFKPPLLVWLAGLSLKILGRSLFALRLPALAAAVCVAVILFWWTRRERPILIACAAATLFLSNPLMHIFARLCYTDMLVLAAISGALASFYADPSLARTRSLWCCGIAVAAGVMAKNVAGLLPLFIVALYCVLVRTDKRPPLVRLALVTLIAAALLAPWHIYQLIAHRQWFWADYVQVQLLGFGVKLPVTSEESQAVFYFRRLFLTDPVLAALLVTGVPFLISPLRGRKDVLPALLTAWFAIAAGALLLFRYQNLPYAILLIAPACLIAAEYNPLFSGQRARWGLLVLCAIFAVKCSEPGKIWGLGFGAAQPLPAVAGLRAYYDLGRTNELILADSDDFFYASTLPLPRVRYYFRVQDDSAPKSFPHYVQLGIMLTEKQFELLPQLEPTYKTRLRNWGLDSTEAVGTAILGQSDDALLRLVRAHPDADYYVTIPELQLLEGDESIRRTHAVRELPYGRAFLLALNTASRPVVPLPARW
jgi:hypothetical protein